MSTRATRRPTSTHGRCTTWWGLYSLEEEYALDLEFILRAVQVVPARHYDEVWGNYRRFEGTKTVTLARTGTAGVSADLQGAAAADAGGGAGALPLLLRGLSGAAVPAPAAPGLARRLAGQGDGPLHDLRIADVVGQEKDELGVQPAGGFRGRSRWAFIRASKTPSGSWRLGVRISSGTGLSGGRRRPGLAWGGASGRRRGGRGGGGRGRLRGRRSGRRLGLRAGA